MRSIKTRMDVLLREAKPGIVPLQILGKPVSTKEKTAVFVLKNHNGSVLKKSTDIQEIADEMLRYEAQTGNKTSIEVQ